MVRPTEKEEMENGPVRKDTRAFSNRLVGSGDREELRLASRFGTKQQGLDAPAVCQEGEGWETGDTE